MAATFILTHISVACRTRTGEAWTCGLWTPESARLSVWTSGLRKSPFATTKGDFRRLWAWTFLGDYKWMVILQNIKCASPNSCYCKFQETYGSSLDQMCISKIELFAPGHTRSPGSWSAKWFIMSGMKKSAINKWCAIIRGLSQMKPTNPTTLKHTSFLYVFFCDETSTFSSS